MALGDYTYRLKAESGDTTPHDELAVSGDLSGGTITLVDRGSGDYCWQFESGVASVAIPGRTLAPAGTGGGITIAMTLRVSNYGATDFAMFAGVGIAAPSSATDVGSGSCYVGRTTANNLRARYTNLGATAAFSAGTTERTLVLKLVTASGSADKLVFYHLSTSLDSAGATMAADVVDTLWVNAVGTAVLQLKDFVFWPEELSDADCQTLRDDGIRATLDGGGGSIVGPGLMSSPLLSGRLLRGLVR